MKRILSLCAIALFGFAAMAHADFDGYWSEIRPPWRASHPLTYDPVGQRMILTAGNSYNVYRNETWSLSLGDTPQWSAVPGPGALTPRDRIAVVYDSARHRLLLYGGRDADHLGAEAPLSDVLALDLAGDGGWVPLETVGDVIPALTLESVLYDPVRDRMLIFGGSDGFAAYNDVWALDLAGTPTWHVLTVSGAPPAARRSQVAMYDPVRDRMIVFGGSVPGTHYNDVWALSLSGTPTWTQLTPGGTSPASRDGAGAIYDPVRDRMIMFGGGVTNDVWALSLSDPVTWTQLTPTGPLPTPRSGTGIAYDPVRDELVVSGDGTNETWRLSLTDPPAWTQATPWGQTAPGRLWHSAIYDPGGGRVVIFGGKGGSSSTMFNDVWTFSPGDLSWTQVAPTGTPPAGRELSSAIYDPVGQRMIVFGGIGVILYNDVWSLSLSGSPAWSPILPSGAAPTPRGEHSAIYDSARNRMVVFGGSNTPDVWALSLGGSPAWSQIFPGGTAPPTHSRHVAIYDPTRDRMLIFGGFAPSSSSTSSNDVWELSFSGTPTWTHLAPLGTPPPPEAGYPGIYDSARDRMLVMGDNAVWELTLAPPMTWRKLDPGGEPVLTRSDGSMTYDPVADEAVIFGGSGGSSGMGDTWVLTFTPTVSVGPTAQPAALSLAPIGSNPVRGDLAVSYSLPVAAPALLDVFDVRGRRVLGVDAPSSAGGHRVVVAPSGSLIEGVYWIRLTQGRVSTVRRAVVLR